MAAIYSIYCFNISLGCTCATFSASLVHISFFCPIVLFPHNYGTVHLQIILIQLLISGFWKKVCLFLTANKLWSLYCRTLGKRNFLSIHLFRILIQAVWEVLIHLLCLIFDITISYSSSIYYFLFQLMHMSLDNHLLREVRLFYFVHMYFEWAMRIMLLSTFYNSFIFAWIIHMTHYFF